MGDERSMQTQIILIYFGHFPTVYIDIITVCHLYTAGIYK